MSILAVIIVILFGAALSSAFYVAFNNQVVLQGVIQFYGEDYAMKVWAVILCAFFGGFALAFALSAIRSSKHAIGRLRDAHDARQRERVERLYAEGLQAVVAENPERAEQRFREVLSRSIDHPETLMSYGEILRASGRSREAADLHRRLASARPTDIRPLLALAADWRGDGDLDKARQALEKAIAINPNESLKARRELRDLLIAGGRWEEARPVQAKIEAAAKGEATIARERRLGLGIGYEIATAYAAGGRRRDAEKELRALLKVDPTFVPASLALGQMLVEDGQVREGVKVWSRAFELSGSPLFLSRLEEHYLGREQPKELVGLFHRLLDAGHSRPVVIFYLGKLYFRLEMIDEAEATFKSLEAEAPDSPVLRYYAAKIMERRGQHRQSADAYRTLIRNSPLLAVQYECRSCEATPAVWQARCESCREWGTVDVDQSNVASDSRALVPVPRPDWAAAP